MLAIAASRSEPMVNAEGSLNRSDSDCCGALGAGEGVAGAFGVDGAAGAAAAAGGGGAAGVCAVAAGAGVDGAGLLDDAEEAFG
jgi:hypothetical protein